MGDLLDRFFKLRQHGTSARTELLGGMTTFVTMAYIIAVNVSFVVYGSITNGSDQCRLLFCPIQVATACVMI